jgi:hypothetical protein
MISLLHPGPGPDCPLTQMRGLELMSTLAFHPARGQTWVTMELSMPVETGTKVIEVAKATTWHVLGDTEFIIANHLESTKQMKHMENRAEALLSIVYIRKLRHI